MSVLIKGMEMPKNCGECQFCHTENFTTYCCPAGREDIFYDEIPEWCPLKEPNTGEWIPVTYRPMDEEEYEEYKKEFGELPIEHRKMLTCPMPEDDQEILICTSWGGVSQDRCEIDEYGYALEAQGDWDGVDAWMPLPKPYNKEGEKE